MLRRRLLGLTLGVALVASSFATGSSAASAEATGLPVGVTGFAVVSSTATTATVKWTAPDDPNRRGFGISIADNGLGGRGGVAAATGARQAAVSGLTPGRTHTLAIVAYGDLGSSAYSSVTVRPIEPLCAGRASCVAVDASSTAGTLAHAASGYLHGLSATTDPVRLAALKAKAWRVSAWDTAAITRARNTGAEVTAVLSDAWYNATMTGERGGAFPPWLAWDFYGWWVEAIVGGLVSSGLAPDYWEIQNEPNAAAAYFGPLDIQTRDQLLQQYRVAHDAIRRALPTAKIVGPSLSVFAPINDWEILDLRTFIEFSVANALRFEAISWHEIGNGGSATFEAGPKAILSHVATVRAILADNPGFGQTKIFINEYGNPWSQLMPGATVGYLAALEEAGVDAANLTCWPHMASDACGWEVGTIDGLLQPDRKTPTDAYWVHAAYAAMSGARVRSSATDANASVLASRASNGEVRVLVGRHGGCNPQVTEHCQFASLAPSVSRTDVVVKLPANAPRRYRLVVERNPEKTGAVASLPTVMNKLVSPSGGQVVIALTSVLDGEAIDVRLTPA